MLRMSKFEKLNTLFICILFFGYYVFFKMDKKNSFFILLFSYNSFFIILPYFKDLFKVNKIIFNNKYLSSLQDF